MSQSKKFSSQWTSAQKVKETVIIIINLHVQKGRTMSLFNPTPFYIIQ